MTIVKSDSINQETSIVNQGLLLPLAENGLCHTDKMLKVKHLYSIFCLLLLTNFYLSVKCQPMSFVSSLVILYPVKRSNDILEMS